MKKSAFLLMTLFITGIISVSGQESKDLVGAWKMVCQKFSTPGETAERTQFNHPQVKIFTEEFFTHNALSDDEQFMGHFGRYEYSGNTYTEHIKYSSYQPFMGQSYTFKSKMKGNKWTIEGTVIIDGTEMDFKETWERIMPGSVEE